MTDEIGEIQPLVLWPTSEDGYNATLHNECGHEPIRWNAQPHVSPAGLPQPGWYGMCFCDDQRERQTTHVTYDACVVLLLWAALSGSSGGPDV